jgi:serine/threonine protein kinase
VVTACVLPQGTQLPQIFAERDVIAAFGGPATYLGTGGFGETWRVGDQAIKIIHRETERVPREVEGQGRVDHSNVVRLLKVETAAVAGAPREVLRFEFIPGGDVERVLAQGQTLPLGELPAFLKGLLGGIRVLHEAEVLHRDLKPGNVALRGGGWSEPVILDLGLARILDQSSITVYPALMGTGPYMAPEQLEGRRVRKAVDLFGAGVLTRQALTGRHPFHPPGADPDLGAYLARINAGPAPLPVWVPESVRTLLDRMVSPAEHERGSTRSCLRDLGDLL